MRRNPLIVAKDTVALAATHLKAATLQTGEGLLNTVETPINANLSHTIVRMRLVIALVQTNLIAELTSSVDPVAAEVLTDNLTLRSHNISIAPKVYPKQHRKLPSTSKKRSWVSSQISLKLVRPLFVDFKLVALIRFSLSNTGLSGV